MTDNNIKIVKILVVLIAAFYFFYPSKVTLTEGVKVPNPPEQSNLYFKDVKLSKNNTPIQAVKEIKLKAKILGKKYYSSEIIPVDLALGWQNMSDEKVLKEFEITQRNRWYFWKTRKFPIPRKDVETQSSNWHIIPANDNIKDIIDMAKEGQIISLKGYLVNVKIENGREFKSSLTRSDINGGACEVMYVDDIEILEIK